MATSQDFVNWVCGEAIDPAFLQYALVHAGRERLASLGEGTVHKTIYFATVKALHVALPPRAEQARIVARLDELLGIIEPLLPLGASLLAGLEQVWAQALRAAFSGELLGQRADRWERSSFGEVARIETHGVDPAEHAALPHIAPNHIERATGRLLPYRTVGEDGVTSRKYRFEAGHIIYSKIRPYLAKAALVDFAGLCSADCYPIATQLQARYLQRYMISPAFTEQAVALQGRTVLPKINKKQLRTITVPVPSAGEQDAIVERIDELEAQIEDVRSVARSAQTNAQRLVRLLLDQAARGELVASDPADEPIEAAIAAHGPPPATPIAQDTPMPAKSKSRSKSKSKSLDAKQLLDAIAELGEAFGFEQLREQLAAPYEDIQRELFELLERDDSPVVQFYDATRGHIRFKRGTA